MKRYHLPWTLETTYNDEVIDNNSETSPSSPPSPPPLPPKKKLVRLVGGCAQCHFIHNDRRYNLLPLTSDDRHQSPPHPTYTTYIKSKIQSHLHPQHLIISASQPMWLLSRNVICSKRCSNISYITAENPFNFFVKFCGSSQLLKWFVEFFFLFFCFKFAVPVNKLGV